MKIAAITNPLHIVHAPPMRRSDEHHYLVIHKMTTRSLRNHVCHVVAEDAKPPVICSRACDHFRYCEFGREYIKRLEAGA